MLKNVVVPCAVCGAGGPGEAEAQPGPEPAAAAEPPPAPQDGDDAPPADGAADCADEAAADPVDPGNQ